MSHNFLTIGHGGFVWIFLGRMIPITFKFHLECLDSFRYIFFLCKRFIMTYSLRSPMSEATVIGCCQHRSAHSNNHDFEFIAHEWIQQSTNRLPSSRVECGWARASRSVTKHRTVLRLSSIFYYTKTDLDNLIHLSIVCQPHQCNYNDNTYSPSSQSPLALHQHENETYNLAVIQWKLRGVVLLANQNSAFKRTSERLSKSAENDWLAYLYQICIL